MKTCKQLNMRTLKEMYIKLFKEWPDHMSDLICGLTLIFSPIYMPLIWVIVYLYQQFKLRNI